MAAVISFLEAFFSQYSPLAIFDISIATQLAFGISFFISSCVAFSNQYAGFLGLLTGIFYISFSLLTYYGIRKRINRTIFGAVLGASSVFLMISLQTSIFWGQYGNCEANHNFQIDRKGAIGVQCTNPSAMKSMCAFSVFLFLSYISQCGILLVYKDNILGDEPLDEGYAPPSAADTVPQSTSYE